MGDTVHQRTNTRLSSIVGVGAALFLAACGGNVTPTAVSAPDSGAASDVNTAAVIDPNTEAQVVQLPTAQPGGGAAVSLPTNSAGLSIVARVNDVEITLADFQRTHARFEQQQIAASDSAALRAAVLNTMIEQILIEQAAGQLGITVSTEEVEAELQASRELAGSQEAWNNWLASNMFSEDEFRATLRMTLLTNRMRDHLTTDLSSNVLQAHARHILVATEGEAQSLLQRLQNGEDFAALAAQYSLDVTSREDGGDLGWFAREELLESSLSDVAFSAEVGQITGPIPSSLGYHILQVLERGEQPVPLEKRAILAQRRFEAWLDSLTEAAAIEVYM